MKKERACNNFPLLCKLHGLIFTAALLLSACGFHLRGMIEVPPWLNHLSIISNDGDKELVSILRSQLEANKIQIYSNPARAKYWLIINRSNLQQRIVGIGASTNSRQYQLVLTVEFMVETVKAQIIKEPKLILVSRQWTVNNDRLLGSNEEESIFLSEMKKEAVMQIIHGLK
jgi:LPS-assembly lipoprotein